jgi:hypothetical protein
MIGVAPAFIAGFLLHADWFGSFFMGRHGSTGSFQLLEKDELRDGPVGEGR